MYEESLNEAELVLSLKKDSVLPVRKVWEEVVKRSKVKGFQVASLADFSAMLDGDSRFKIIPARENIEDEILTGEVDDEEMERLGFYPEDRVMLRTSPVAKLVISDEDEEEIGSIRRKAFVEQKFKAKNAKIIVPEEINHKKVSSKLKKKITSKKKSKTKPKTRSKKLCRKKK